MSFLYCSPFFAAIIFKEFFLCILIGVTTITYDFWHYQITRCKSIVFIKNTSFSSSVAPLVKVVRWSHESIYQCFWIKDQKFTSYRGFWLVFSSFTSCLAPKSKLWCTEFEYKLWLALLGVSEIECFYWS